MYINQRMKMDSTITNADAKEMAITRAFEVIPDTIKFTMPELDTAIEVSDQLLKNSAASIAETKKMIRTVSNMSVESAVEYCIGLNTISRSADEFKEGLQKFLDK